MGELSWYITALVMGLAGSLHCLGMCGPIFMASGSLFNHPVEFIKPLTLHHLGKLFSYAALGLVMGIVGKGISLIWFQNTVMLVCGIILLIMGIGGLIQWRTLVKFNQWISTKMGQLLKQKNKGHLLLGIINGMVPCGLVYAAAVGAAATQHVWQGALFMVFFGIGTVPALSIAGFGHWLVPLKKFKNLNIWKQIPVILLGLWLFFKGLGLGIPYISPDLNSHKPAANCCEKHLKH